MKDVIKEKFKHLESANGYTIAAHIKRNPEIATFLDKELKIYPEFGNRSNLIKCIINNIEFKDLPKCKTCNKTTTFEPSIHTNNGHREYCSCKCRSNNKIVKDKTAETNIQRYGAINVWASSLIKEQMSKKCIAKFGVSHIGLCKTSHIKRKQKMLDTYGMSTMFYSKELKENNKIKQFKRAYENMRRFIEVSPKFTEEEFIFNRTNNKLYEFAWVCKKCGQTFKQVFFKNCRFPRCYNCYPLMNNTSNLETEIFNFISSLNIECSRSNRCIISPLELDIVIPSKKIAIEFNGNYWHSEDRGKDEYYHLNKTNKCIEQGYRLIHIFEDEWFNKQKIVKARLKNILGFTSRKIYARKCEVREIDNDIKDKFLEYYHIQGKDKSKTKLGLFYKNRLVAVMTFGKRRFDDKEGFELIRYATIANFNIVGGAGKLLAYFRKQHIGETIISYADKRWSQGNLYKQLGFTLLRESTPNYFYINKEDGLTRLSRHMFMKHKLKDILLNFNNDLSEVENMRNNNYVRIFDCGNYVFELK